MKALPVLVRTDLVLDILDERKTQTRRIVKTFDEIAEITGQPGEGKKPSWAICCRPPAMGVYCNTNGKENFLFNPHGYEGDRLWVREAFKIVPRTAYPDMPMVLHPVDNHDAAIYRAGWDKSSPGRWSPSIHMPRWASRLSLEITAVRVERLQDITDADARAEGVADRAAFAKLWDQINGKGAWDANPWVWVITFKKVPS